MQFKDVIVVIFSCLPSVVWPGSDSVKLRKIEVLTLHHGLMTNGRRSSPVPQLKCVGGTAGCKSFIPQVVQCYNRGSDGTDVQWECKTDMDNAYRFGQISVSCEGFSYADDPYVLKGSCGLEYTLDLTKEGHQQNSYGNSGYNRESSSYSYSRSKDDSKSQSSDLGTVILLLAVVLVIYALYKTVASPTRRLYQSSSTNDDFGGGYPDGNPYRSSNAAPRPPAPGFRSEFTQPGASCGTSSSSRYDDTNSAGGFWTGAATGSLLGYMFGNREARSNENTRNRGFGNNSNSNWGGTSRRENDSNSASSSQMEAPSSGTRTASGFGGTTRR